MTAAKAARIQTTRGYLLQKYEDLGVEILRINKTLRDLMEFGVCDE